MKTTGAKFCRTLLLGCLLGALTVPRGAWGQEYLAVQGLYQGTDDATGGKFLLRLELPAPQPETYPIYVATLLNPNGSSRVFAGTAQRGGLNIHYGVLCPAKTPALGYAILLRPIALLAGVPETQGFPINNDVIDLQQCCQLYFLTGTPDYTYRCGGGGGTSGTLHKIRQ